MTKSAEEIVSAFKGFGSAWAVKWHNQRHYIEEHEIEPEHIPVLLQMVAEYPNTDWSQDLPENWAGVHAWRALGQLRATEFFEPALKLFLESGDDADDLMYEDFEHLLPLVCGGNISRLAECLADTEFDEFSRVTIAASIANLAKNEHKFRDQAVAILTSQLEKHSSDYALNGALVNRLVQVEAKESAESIEKAFAAQAVDSMMSGNWDRVRNLLGVEGLGLVPDESPQSRDFGSVSNNDEEKYAQRQLRFDAQQQQRRKAKKERARAARKNKRKAKKRSRKK